MLAHLLRLSCILGLIIAGNILAWPQTKGSPLGGMGAGYVKFDATQGDFATSSRIPPGGGDMVCEFPNRMSNSSGFHFYAGGQVVTKAKTNVEDAKCPLYSADFGVTNNVRFELTAFGPFHPGTEPIHIQLSTSPAACFEIVATNSAATAQDVAVALEFTNRSSGVAGLLGGADNATIDPESANKGISFATAEFSGDLSPGNSAVNTGNSYILVDCSKEGATFSAGALSTFAATGALSNTTGDAVSAKVNLGPGESVSFKFVMAWWRTFVSGQARYVSGENDDDNFYYHNYYSTSKEVASFVMQHFDNTKAYITNMVSRVMASNFPEWYKDRLFNNTYPTFHNSLWAKDGRAAYWEGKYGIIGTIDQGQHAAVWYAHTLPHNQWLELSYWLSNAFQDPAIKGQIHHDFNISPGMTFNPPESRFMAPWGHWDREDYWFQPNTTDWSDLNSMLIFKAYELMTATGDKDSLTKHFPKIKETAYRLHKMSEEGGANIPISSRSTYDSDGSLTPQYACGCAVAAYNCMVDMAKFVGDQAAADSFQVFYTGARKDFKDLLFDEDYGNIPNQGWGEGHVGGYAWANYFCLPPIQDKDFIETGCTRLWDMYSPNPDPKGRVGGWHFYTYDHLGGALTAIGRPDQALQFHKWDHELNYVQNPDQVFWQELFSQEIGPQKYASYMTAPNIWRSYHQFMGYLLDNAYQRLWVRPNLPTEMNNTILNAALIEPKTLGSLFYSGNIDAATSQSQYVRITYDNPVTIKEIVLKNNALTTTPFAIIDNTVQKLTNFTIVAEDWGVDQNLRITFTEPIQIGPAGLNILVYTHEVGTIVAKNTVPSAPLAITSSTLSGGKPIRCSISKPGRVLVELISLNGAKIGTLIDQNVAAAGSHSFNWNGKTLNGKKLGSFTGVLRLTTAEGTASKLVHNLNN